MGLLAENKTRSKINKDPNNTKWTRDTTTFGQKILRSQGWQPGQFLGATNAPHSELHTAANASYIRVALKDDMKGLGFSRAKEDEITGLDVFQDLLSRLNGKSEGAVEEDRQTRLAVKANHYVEQRWGPMRFVRGGLLVGDELREEPKTEEDSDGSSSEAEGEEAADVEMSQDSTPKESKKDKKSKKRKASDDDDADTSGRDSESKSKKRRKEERKLKEADDSTDDAKARKKEKKEKKRARKAAAEGSENEGSASDERSKKRKSKSKDASEESDDDRVKSKKSKKDKKEKKDKKDKKKRRKEEAEASDETPAESVAGTGTTTPGTGTSTPRGSRNFVRSRFIAQKRQAVLDTKALNQIFMVKA
ncbi:hypothetical protein EDB80DRAFT_695510 [Ilyonectria destructans]|nr:hypothetical protein EDB80DRAFT_695510 [Ilyonectria destructans]